MINQKQSGIYNVMEHIQELLYDVQYKLYGPAHNDRDYKQQLIEDGYWEEEVLAWEEEYNALTKEEKIRLDEREDTLRDILLLCEKLAKKVK